MIIFILAILLMALGWLWALRIADRNNDGDEGAALAAVGLMLLGAAIFVIRLLVFIYMHVHWGW